MFLPWIALALPEDSPFWTARENDGLWPKLGRQSQRTVLDKPGLVLVNHGSSGTSEIISGKVYDEDHNHSKIVFNTHFPWEDHNPQGGTSQEYSFRSLDPRGLRGAEITSFEEGSRKVLTASIAGRQVALIAYHGWDSVKAQVHRAFNAEAEESTVLGAYRKRTAENPAMELMICVMLHKTEDTAWTKDELSPLENIKLMDVMPSGSVIGAELTLADSTKYVVDFKEVDGYKSC